MFPGRAAVDYPSSQIQRVKVEDALSYLDQVKTQFANQQAVYSLFLDIMKDFKAQAIDTPGVIARVSRLFRGRPQLIMGFNTFLPPGFEVQVDGDRITISDPSGNLQIINDDFQRQTPTTSGAPAQTMAEPVPPDEPGTSTPSYSPPESREPDSVQPQTAGFSQAVGYVNKIKVRFAHDPSVYKQFLDILHQYQRNLKGSASNAAETEKSVLAAIARLFKNEPDLLEEFRHFLPDVGAQVGEKQVRETRVVEHDEEEEEEEGEEEDEQEEEQEEEPDEADEDDEAEAEEDEDDDDRVDARKTRLITAAAAQRRKAAAKGKRASGRVWPEQSWEADEKALAKAMGRVTMEELRLFDRLRRSLAKQPGKFDQALRMFGLFAKGIIASNELVSAMKNLLGNKYPLLHDFKVLLGVAEGEPSTPSRASLSAVPEIPSDIANRLDYTSVKQLGVSYRALPDSFPRPVCSGRTQLCREVLNDTWVSLPSWASEDSSCVSAKKTQYEENLYRTEDERFELDIVLEVNKYALTALWSVKSKMASMKKDELDKFRLDERLGGTSPSLMFRAIKRLYGEHTTKMIEALKRNPAQFVPKVIARLEQKQTEWKEAQLHLNLSEKNLMRSLDHQTASLKTADSKWLKAKALVHHIEVLYDERQNKGLCEDGGPHIVLHYPSDRLVLHDVNNLIIHFVKRQANMQVNNIGLLSSVQKDEKKRVKAMLRQHVLDMFSMPEEAMSEEDSEGEEDSPRKSHNPAPLSTTPVKDVKPRLPKTPVYRLIYGGNALYVFFRVHHMICDRLDRLKRKCAEMLADYEEGVERAQVQAALFSRYGKSIEGHEMNASDTQHGLELLRGGRAESPAPYYSRLISEVKNLLDAAVDINVFEENVRAMFPVDGYLAFTLDKMISVAARQLQILCSPADHPRGLTLSLYRQFKTDSPTDVLRPSPENLKKEADYATKAEQLICNENCFKLVLIDDGHKVDLNAELIDTEPLEDDNKDDETVKSAQRKAEEAVEEEDEEEEDKEKNEVEGEGEEDEETEEEDEEDEDEGNTDDQEAERADETVEDEELEEDEGEEDDERMENTEDTEEDSSDSDSDRDSDDSEGGPPAKRARPEVWRGDDTTPVRPATAVFLKRNIRRSKGKQLGEFEQSIDVDHVVNLRGGPPSLTAGSCEFFIRRRKRMSDSRKIFAFEQAVERRRRRCREWVDKKVERSGTSAFTWFIRGTRKTTMHHDKYSFLSYNIYSIKK